MPRDLLTATLKKGSLRFNELTVLVCLVMGTMRILMGVLRFGFIADFISVPVLSSFVSGAGCVVGGGVCSRDSSGCAGQAS